MLSIFYLIRELKQRIYLDIFGILIFFEGVYAIFPHHWFKGWFDKYVVLTPQRNLVQIFWTYELIMDI